MLEQTKRAAALLGIAAGLTLASGAPTRSIEAPKQEGAAADPAQLERGKVVWGERAGCASCHGWAADGENAGPSPEGPSLRTTELDAAQIHEVVQCGRPGTAMPYHDRQAYKDTRCYGSTKADLGDQAPTPGVPLSAKEIDAVTAYVVTNFKGRGEVTLAECQAYFSPTSPRCKRYEPGN
jgi:mono/diheme cytochrome c family protein